MAKQYCRFGNTASVFTVIVKVINHKSKAEFNYNSAHLSLSFDVIRMDIMVYQHFLFIQ